MNVLVLGAGPAGLLAAWGARTCDVGDVHVTIWDRDTAFHPERIFSLQYMHDPCDVPGATSLELSYSSDLCSCGIYLAQGSHTEPCVLARGEAGSRRQAKVLYNLKLNRPMDEENSTRFLFETPVKVWSLKSGYAWLYQYFQPVMERHEVTWGLLLEESKSWDVVINTVPLDKLRPDLGWPVRRGLIAMGWVPMELPENSCVYSLDPDVPWYRATYLDGGKATEFVYHDISDAAKAMIFNLRPLRKVADNSLLTQISAIELLPSNLVFTGRWGAWDSKLLTHHAYYAGKEAVRKVWA